jgi:hypothetical protein
VIYALSVQFNWALFSYFPILGKLRFGLVAASRDTGPAMYWYGWIATSALGAIAVCVVALMLPRMGEKLWPTLSWAVPVMAMAWTTWVTAKIWFF